MGAPQGNQNAAGKHFVMQVGTDKSGALRPDAKWAVMPPGTTRESDLISLHGSRSSAHRAAHKLNGPQATAMRAAALREP